MSKKKLRSPPRRQPMTARMTSAVPESPVKARLLSFGFPPDTSGKAKALFGLVAAVLLIAAIAGPVGLRHLILQRQIHLPANAMWRAIDALQAGDEEQSRIEVDIVIHSAIREKIYGRTLPYYAPAFNQLAELLFERERDQEARAVAYKAIRHYHRLPRGVEYLTPWQQLEVSYFDDDFARFLNVFRILAANSLYANQGFYQRHSNLTRFLRTSLRNFSALREYYMNFAPEKFVQIMKNVHVRPLKSDLQNPETIPVELEIAEAMIHIQAHMRVGNKPGADAIARDLKMRHPRRFESLAMAAFAQKEQNPYQFTKKLKAPKRWQVLDFSGFKSVHTEYDDVAQKPKDAIITKDGAARARVKSAGVLAFKTERPVRRMYLIASGTEFLELYPIVFAQVDEGEIYPLFIDELDPAIFLIEIALEPGPHEIRLEFINDYNGDFKDRHFDRDAMYYRMVLELE